MSDASRELELLIDAFRAHYVAARETEPDSDRVTLAEERLEDAFFAYDNALFQNLGAELPFDIFFEDDDEAFELDDDDDDDEITDFLILNEDAFDEIDLAD